MQLVASEFACIFPVLGFIPSEFSGIERGVTYTVMAGFLSGKPPQGGNLNLNLMLGTAGKPFIQLLSPYYTLPLSTVFTF